MNTFNIVFAGMFGALTAIFALALAPRWASHFYPSSPPLAVRFVAPSVFALLASACFCGFALPALCVVVALGLTLIVVSRRRKPAA